MAISFRTALLVASVLTTRTLLSTSYTWNVTSGNAMWDNAANWTPNTGFPQNSGDVAIFSTPLVANTVATLGTNIVINSIQLAMGNQHNLTVSGSHSMTFDNGGSIQTTGSIASFFLNTPVVLQAGGADSITVSMTVGNPAIEIPQSGATTISGGNAGPSPNTLVVTGTTGTFVMGSSGNNTYTGVTKFNGGMMIEVGNATNVTTIPGDLQVTGSGRLIVPPGDTFSTIASTSNMTVNTTGNFNSTAPNLSIASLTFLAGGFVSASGSPFGLNATGNALTMGNVTLFGSPALIGNQSSQDVVFDASHGGTAIINDFGGGTDTFDLGSATAGGFNRVFTIPAGGASVDMQILIPVVDGGAGVGIDKAGSGTLQLTNANNNYSAPTNVNAGTLSISSDGNIGTAANSPVLNLGEATTLQASGASSSLSSATTIHLSGTSTGINFDTNSNSFSIASVILGSGPLNKINPGTLTLSATNPYTGATSVTGGTLSISSDANIGTAANSPVLNLGEGATLQASGASSSLALATTINLSGTSTGINFDTNSNAFAIASHILGTGPLNKINPGTLTLSSTNTYSESTIIDGGTLQAGAANVLSNNSPHTINGGTLALNGNAQTIPALTFNSGSLTQGGALLTLDSNGMGPELTMEGNNNTISGPITLAGINNPIDVAYLTTQSGPAIISGSVDFGTGGRVFNIPMNSNPFDMEVSGNISNDDGGGLTKQDTGILRLAGNNTYTGPTTVSAGTLQAGAMNTFVSVSDHTVAMDGTLDLNIFSQTIGSLGGAGSVTLGSATLTTGATQSTQFDGGITGTGGLTKVGSSTTFALGSTNNYTGTTNVSAGTLSLSGAGTVASSSTIDVATSATFEIDGASATVSIVDLSGSGLAHMGAVDLILTNPTSNFSGTLSGDTAGLTKQGGGIFTLSGTSSYTGATQVSNGTLKAGANNTFASGSDFTVVSGATLDVNSTSQTISSLSGAGSATLGSGALTLSGNPSVFSGGITGVGGSLTVTGGAMCTLSTPTSANAYTGATLVTAGAMLEGGAINALAASSDHTINTGTLLNLNNFSQTIGSLAGGGNVTLGSGTLTTGSTSTTTFSGGIMGTGGLTKVGSGKIFTLTGTNGYSGATNVSAGTLQAGAANVFASGSNHTVTGVLDLNSFSQTIGSLAGGGSVTLGTGTLTTGSTASTTFSGGITGAGGLTKVGSTTFVLSGTNNFSGATAVTAGRLNVNGSLITVGGVQVNSGATLGGSGGTVTGVITVNSGGRLSPGSSIGTLNVVGNVNLGPNATFATEINASGAASLLNATGSFNIGSNDTLFVTVDPGIYPSIVDYTVVDAASGVTGQFATVATSLPTFQVSVEYTPDTVVLAHVGTLPFSVVVVGGNAGAAAACFDTLNTSTGDASLVAAELRMIPTVEGLTQAFALIQPSQFTALALAEESATLYTNDTIFERLLQNTHICPVPCVKAAPKPAPAPKRWRRKQPEPAPAPVEEKVCPSHKRGGFWLTPFGALAQQTHESGQPGFETETGGITTGMDFAPNTHWTLGAALGYSYIHLHWKDGRGHSNIQNGYGALYTAVTGKYAYLLGSAIGSYNHYDATRNMQIGDEIIIPIDRTAKSIHHGWQGSGHLQAGLLFGKKVQFSPFVQADYIYVHENSFNEHGAKSLDLHVQNKNSDLLEGEVGVEFSRCFSTSRNKIAPSLGISGIREWRFTGKHYNSSFQGSSCVVRTGGMNPDRTLLSGMAGCTILLPDENRTLSFEYKGKWGENFQDNRLLAQFLVRF